MKPYSSDVERTMLTFFGSLREKDRRRYAAVEAAKLGPTGVMYIAGLLGIDPNTVRKGIADLSDLPDVPPEDVRKRGAAKDKHDTGTRRKLSFHPGKPYRGRPHAGRSYLDRPYGY